MLNRPKMVVFFVNFMGTVGLNRKFYILHNKTTLPINMPSYIEIGLDNAFLQKSCRQTSHRQSETGLKNSGTCSNQIWQSITNTCLLCGHDWYWLQHYFLRWSHELKIVVVVELSTRRQCIVTACSGITLHSNWVHSTSASARRKPAICLAYMAAPTGGNWPKPYIFWKAPITLISSPSWHEMLRFTVFEIIIVKRLPKRLKFQAPYWVWHLETVGYHTEMQDTRETQV